jgi:hypothetical protein
MRSALCGCLGWRFTRQGEPSVGSSGKALYREGMVYFGQAGRVQGVLLWNVWDQVDAARQLIDARGPFRPVDLPGRLPS